MVRTAPPPPSWQCQYFHGFVIFWQYFQSVNLGNASIFRPLITVTLQFIVGGQGGQDGFAFIQIFWTDGTKGRVSGNQRFSKRFSPTCSPSPSVKHKIIAIQNTEMGDILLFYFTKICSVFYCMIVVCKLIDCQKYVKHVRIQILERIKIILIG